MNSQERIKFIKEYLGGISQKALSDFINIPIGIIAAIEKGQQKSFNYNLAVAINQFCKENNLKPITISWQMSGEGEIFETPHNTLEQKVSNLDKLLQSTDDAGKRIDFIRIYNNLSVEDFISILEITKERYIELCLENKSPSLKELVLLKANFDVDIDTLLFDELNEIKKMIGEKSEFDNKINKLSPIQRASIKNMFKN